MMHRRAGFSLLEVLVAIVVLTVGLLALAALQGKLTGASAEAKTRARVAAALTAHMDELRQEGYNSDAMDDVAATTTSGNVNACVDDAHGTPERWLDCATRDAAVGSLTVRQEIRVWAGSPTFVEQAVGSSPVNGDIPQFKRIKLDAEWFDASNTRHTMQLQSDISAMALTNTVVVPPPPLNEGMGGPIVRTTTPAVAGVIPMALGTDSNTATTNPAPELVGSRNNQIVVGTRFSVLNYSAPGFGDSVQIQKRFDQEVVKCTCKYGAGGNNLPLVFRTAQWPAVWNGDAYAVVKPAGNPAAPGQSLASGPKSGVTQSDLCQECCRDHHDTGASGQVRFDPERNGTAKFDFNGTNFTAVNTNNGTYVNACRVVRVDGFWRTASDLYARQYGLLPTQAVSNVDAKSGLPTTDSVNQYTTLVRGFLAEYNSSSTSPPTPSAQQRFTDNVAFNAPTITIASASNTDYRYLHGRGLYVDHLEQEALDKLGEVLADDGPQGACPSTTLDKSECVMPYLPFTTVNLTEIAKWTASSTAILTVNSGNLLSEDREKPSGSRTTGKSLGTANNTTEMRLSNSGVAINAGMPNVAGVDADDNNTVTTDTQVFTVGGSTGGSFDAHVTGGGGNPFVYFTLGTDNNVECLKPAGSDHHCVVSSGNTLPQAGSVVLSNYWLETTTNRSITGVCGGRTVTDTIAVPTFRNYVVTTATLGGVNGTIAPPVSDNKILESTTISFTAISQGSVLMLGLVEQAGSPTYATIATCQTNGGGNKINNPTWNKPWLQ